MTTSESPAVRLRIDSNTDLSEEDFQAQRTLIRQAADWDRNAYCWYRWIRAENFTRDIALLEPLFEAARRYGTRVQIDTPVGNQTAGA